MGLRANPLIVLGGPWPEPPSSWPRSCSPPGARRDDERRYHDKQHLVVKLIQKSPRPDPAGMPGALRGARKAGFYLSDSIH